MKKTIFFIAMACLPLCLTSCSEDYEDASSKHVYGETENPYLRTDVEATVAFNAEFKEGRVTPQILNLKDYAEIIQTKLGMTVADMIAGLETGQVVFYNINAVRGAWDKTPATKGTAGWYYAADGLLETGGKAVTEQNHAACIELDKAGQRIIVAVPDTAKAGLSIAENVGFALNNGKDYDRYVRFNISIAVTNPGMVISNITIPSGDYAAFSIDFADYKEVIEKNMDMTLAEFVSQCKSTDNDIAMYMVDNATGKWDTESSYTANNLGYWLDGNSHVTTWNTPGFSLFVETGDDGTVSIGRAPAIASGTRQEVSFVYAVKDNPARFFQFKLSVTFE